MNGNGNNTPQREENDGINWEDLERESQELVELENCQPCTDAQLTIVAPAVNGDIISSGGPYDGERVGNTLQGDVDSNREMSVDEGLISMVNFPVRG